MLKKEEQKNRKENRWGKKKDWWRDNKKKINGRLDEKKVINKNVRRRILKIYAK